jgi:hypothetical protein
MRLAPISSRETRGAKVEACASRKAAIARTREPQTTADQRPQRGGACGLRRQRGPNQALKGQGFTGSADALRLSAGDQIERKRDTRRKRQNDAPIDRTLRNDHRSHEPQAKAQRLARGHALPQQHGKDAARRTNEIGACRRRQRDPRPGKKITGHRGYRPQPAQKLRPEPRLAAGPGSIQLPSRSAAPSGRRWRTSPNSGTAANS